MTAWVCHLQNRTSSCSVLKMQPHYPLLQNSEKSQCTINMVQKQKHQEHAFMHTKELEAHGRLQMGSEMKV